MKKSSYIIILTGILLLAASCSKESFLPDDKSSILDGNGKGKVTLTFRLNSAATTRAEYSEADMMKEESNVSTLLYAIFQEKKCKEYKKIVLGGTYRAGDNDIYTLTDINKEWFDETTEIFAVANASEELENELFTEKPIIDNGILQQLVADSLSILAKINIFNTLIEAQLVKDTRTYPAAAKFYYKPAATNNYTANKHYTLTESQMFTGWNDLHEKRNKAAVDSDERTKYDEIIEDLECRFILFQQDSYKNELNTLTANENSNHIIADGISAEPLITRYFLWSNYIYNEDLNVTAAASDSRTPDAALMTGYLALTDDIGSIITVPVEHVYCRIWFQFNFTGNPDAAFAENAKYIDVTRIEVSGLADKSKLFNLSSIGIENNIEGANTATSAITAKNDNAPNIGQSPFFGNLTETPQHFGNQLEILRYYPDHPAYCTVCRYPLLNGNFDTDNGKRYYIYSYQWGGTHLEDDPKITLHYSLTEPGNTAITGKTAWAYLYDESHSNSKKHHGLLRNYTYGVNCQLNANTLNLTLQVAAHDWYINQIDDIPTFE